MKHVCLEKELNFCQKKGNPWHWWVGGGGVERDLDIWLIAFFCFNGLISDSHKSCIVFKKYRW
jgi:hypothetical protein